MKSKPILFWPTFQISTVLFFSDMKYVTITLTARGIFQSDEMKVFFPLTLLTLSWSYNEKPL